MAKYAADQALGVHVDLSHEAPTLPGDTLTVATEPLDRPAVPELVRSAGRAAVHPVG